MGDASLVVLSFPADLSQWGRRQLETPWVVAYLKKTLGTVAVGTTTEEFLDVGCCGDTLDVPLRVERIEGGTTVGDSTDIEFTHRETGAVAGGWRVQSASGPSYSPDVRGDTGR